VWFIFAFLENFSISEILLSSAFAGPPYIPQQTYIPHPTGVYFLYNPARIVTKAGLWFMYRKCTAILLLIVAFRRLTPYFAGGRALKSPNFTWDEK
jgi:hypothetical protein